MAVATIASYFYNHGFTTAEFNRKIVFGMDVARPTAIYARVFAFQDEEWKREPI